MRFIFSQDYHFKRPHEVEIQIHKCLLAKLWNVEGSPGVSISSEVGGVGACSPRKHLKSGKSEFDNCSFRWSPTSSCVAECLVKLHDYWVSDLAFSLNTAEPIPRGHGSLRWGWDLHLYLLFLSDTTCVVVGWFSGLYSKYRLLDFVVCFPAWFDLEEIIINTLLTLFSWIIM